MLDLSKCRLTPFAHQVIGIEELVKWNDPEKGRVYGGCFGLLDEMGAGKTLQVIVAMQILYQMGLINKVLVVCPNSVKSVWFDPEFGELSKHLWLDTRAIVSEFHSQRREWLWPGTGPKEGRLHFMITNYEFIRSKDRLRQLKPFCDQKTFLVLDESSAVKGWKTQQTKACIEFRGMCGRVVELNGTPIANNPGDLFSQAQIMDPRILGCKTFFHFRARYGIMGGWQGKQIVAWRDLEDLKKRLAPYVLRRLKSDCLDLPEKLDSIVLSVPMDNPTWKIYKEMKEDMVAWLNDTTLSSASQAIVKTIRLSQITSGFLGGIEYQALDDQDAPDFIPGVTHDIDGEEWIQHIQKVAFQEIGREKLDFFLGWLTERLEEDPNLKLLVWCRFRPEVQRLFEELQKFAVKLSLGKIWGGQKRPERDAALQLLDPRSAPKGPVVVIGTPASGSMGLNLTAAHTVIYLSNDYSLKTRLQSEDRVHRPGQINKVSYFDVIATGPQGQKTIDHAVVKALKAKEDIANWVTADWIRVLEEE